MHKGCGTACGAGTDGSGRSDSGTAKLEQLLVEAAHEFTGLLESKMGFDALCRSKFSTQAVLLLTQCGILSAASEGPPLAGASPREAAAANAKQEFAEVAVKLERGGAATARGPALQGSSAASGRIPAAAPDALAESACQCRTSTCFDFACVARAPKARYHEKNMELRRCGRGALEPRQRAHSSVRCASARLVPSTIRSARAFASAGAAQQEAHLGTAAARKIARANRGAEVGVRQIMSMHMGSIPCRNLGRPA